MSSQSDSIESGYKPELIPDMSFYQSLCRKMIFSLFEKLRGGRITIVQGNQEFEFGEGDGPEVKLLVYDPACYRRFLHGGFIEAGRTYMEGLWDTDNLTDLCRFIANNRNQVYTNKPGFIWLLEPFQRLIHYFRSNSKQGSKQNIRAHYDISNDFFDHFLDDTLTYSCAHFPEKDASLETAQKIKMDKLCQKLELEPGDHLLEIGTGWGGLARFAVEQYGCEVTTTTISDEQYEYSRRQIQEHGLEDQITVLKRDYRDLTGEFDHLVSVEMIEAVGHEYLETFFQSCEQLVKKGGRIALQAITIRDDLYESYLKTTDFIRHFIFPGGHLPSEAKIREIISGETSLSFNDVENQGEHYAETLRRWNQRFSSNIDKIRSLEFEESFLRMWEYYFCYCEAGFLSGTIDNQQILLQKP